MAKHPDSFVHVKAARALEAALVRQFGESARETVAEQVGSFLQGRTLFVRGDLDAIERGVLEKVREKRQVTAASTPLPLGGSRPKSAAAVAAAQSAPVETNLQQVGSKSSPHLVMVPKPVLLKPPDCFDLWREYDSLQYANEEAEKRRAKQAQAKRHLEALSEQVQQAKARREVEASEKEKDREALLAQVHRSQSEATAELAKKLQKKQMQKEASLELLASVEKKKSEAAHRIKVAKTAMDRTLLAEEQYRQQELLRREKLKGEESKLMQQQFELSQAWHQESQQKEKEEDRRMALEWKRLAAKPQEAELPGGMLHKIRSNQKRVDALVGSMGVALVEKQRAQEAAKEELIEKHCRDYEQKRMDDLFARKDDRARRTREMFVDIQKQIDHKNLVKGVEDRAADLRQVEMWRENTEAFHREELMKQQAKHTARKELDAELFDAMMRKAGTHKSTCPGDVDQDLLLNRPLVEKMAKSGFKKDRTVPMLEKAMALKAKQRRHLRPDGES